MLVLFTNIKWHTACRLVPKSVTLNDLVAVISPASQLRHSC